MQKKDFQEVWGTSTLTCNGMDEGEHAMGFQLVECPCVASVPYREWGRQVEQSEDSHELGVFGVVSEVFRGCQSRLR